ncbi:acyltransferase family protein [Streptococcus dentapri]|uniref:Acyltransferase family protein n=1 Tax=Streptococcus dentapri TaxID=573564 RepID=A0ABV8D0W3_9STRE
MEAKRIQWIDFGKGLTIFLVFLGHVILGLFDSQQFISLNRSLLTIVELLYIFHIPVFFALSGYFFKPLTNLKEFWSFAKKKTVLLGIPYLFYSVIQVVLQQIGGSAVRDPAELGDLLTIYKMPLGVSWYLYVLWAIYLSLGLLSVFIRDKKGLFTLTAIGFVIALLFPIHIYLVQKLLLWSFIFILGSFLREFIKESPNWRGASYMILFYGVLVVLFMLRWRKLEFIGYTSYDTPDVWGLIFPFSVLFAFTVYPLLAKISFASYFIAKGKDSLAIYLLHAPIVSILRIALIAVGVHSLWLHLSIGIVFGWLLVNATVWIFKKVPLLSFFLYPQKILKLGVKR